MGKYTFNGTNMGKSERAYVRDSSLVGEPIERAFAVGDTVEDTDMDDATIAHLDGLVKSGYATFDEGS